MSEKQFDLPDECWELIFRSFTNHRDYRSVSSVCKQFLSITNHLQSSLAIIDPMIFCLPRLLLRFPAIKSIDLSHFHGDLNPVLHLISESGLDLDSLDVSGNRTNLIVGGLRELGSTMRNLRVLRYSKAGFLNDDYLIVIADCFSSLQELDISFPNVGVFGDVVVTDFGIKKLATKVKDLRKVNLSGNRSITDASLFSLCESCEFLSEITIQNCFKTTLAGISSAIRQRLTLTSISLGPLFYGNGSFKWKINSDFVNSLMSLKGLTAIDLSVSSVPDEIMCSLAEQGFPLKKIILKGCYNYTYTGLYCLLSKYQSVQYLDLQHNVYLTDYDVINLSPFLRNLTFINLTGCTTLTTSTFLTLARRCCLLNEIMMETTAMGFHLVQEVAYFGVNFQIKTLHLGQSQGLKDKDLKKIASVCPNLEYLDLNFCLNISARCVAHVLRTCCMIRHLNLAQCSSTGLFCELEFHFLLPNLEMLNLSHTGIGDESLIVISNICCGLTHLDLQNCWNMTENGVNQVVLKCTRLREIDLKNCKNVETDTDIVYSMVSSRKSLRKIVAPRGYVPSMREKELFLNLGCLVC